MPRKQGTILGLMLGAVGLILLGQVLSWVRERPPETALVRLHVEEPVLICGTVQAEAEILDLPQGDDWFPCVAKGDRVASGQAVYQKGRSRGLETAALSVRLLRGAAETDLATVSRRSRLLESIAAQSGGGTGQRPDLAEQTALLAMAEQDRETLCGELERAETILMGYGAKQRQTVTAPRAGIFAGDRIVAGEQWYLETELPFAVEMGQTLEAELLGDIFRTVTLTVEAEHGKILLSCQECLAQAVQCETLTAKILKDSETGLEIPATAVYTVGEETGVYVYSGGSARWQSVTLLLRQEDTAIVQPTKAAGLRPGDRVLLEG